MSVVPPAVVGDLAPEGVLRVSINLGNAVLAGGTPDEPRGVTVDLAREIAAGRRRGAAGLLRRRPTVCRGPRHRGVDVGFLAIEPEREAELAFTAPYALIEGVYVVPERGPSAPSPTWTATASASA